MTTQLYEAVCLPGVVQMNRSFGGTHARPYFRSPIAWHNTLHNTRSTEVWESVLKDEYVRKSITSNAEMEYSPGDKSLKVIVDGEECLEMLVVPWDKFKEFKEANSMRIPVVIGGNLPEGLDEGAFTQEVTPRPTFDPTMAVSVVVPSRVRIPNMAVAPTVRMFLETFSSSARRNGSGSWTIKRNSGRLYQAYNMTVSGANIVIRRPAEWTPLVITRPKFWANTSSE